MCWGRRWHRAGSRSGSVVLSDRVEEVAAGILSGGRCGWVVLVAGVAVGGVWCPGAAVSPCPPGSWVLPGGVGVVLVVSAPVRPWHRGIAALCLVVPCSRAGRPCGCGVVVLCWLAVVGCWLLGVVGGAVVWCGCAGVVVRGWVWVGGDRLNPDFRLGGCGGWWVGGGGVVRPGEGAGGAGWCGGGRGRGFEPGREGGGGAALVKIRTTWFGLEWLQGEHLAME